VVVTPAAPKVNLKLVAKGVAKVAVSKITRSEPTSPLNHRDVSHRDPHATKVISAKFGSEGGSSGAIPSRPVLESRAGDSSSDPASFKAGDKIVYPGHGVGEIEGVRVTNLGGDVHHIYNIKILESGMKVMVPVSQAQSVGLRKIIDKKAIDEVYEILRDRDFKIDTQTWNRRFREYSQKIKTGSVFEIAIVLRDLSVLSADKELSFGEKKMLDMAESLLVSEIAIAKARPHDKIVGELRSLFV
jgi:CarD family transcriptional regulator